MSCPEKNTLHARLEGNWFIQMLDTHQLAYWACLRQIRHGKCTLLQDNKYRESMFSGRNSWSIEESGAGGGWAGWRRSILTPQFHTINTDPTSQVCRVMIGQFRGYPTTSITKQSNSLFKALFSSETQPSRKGKMDVDLQRRTNTGIGIRYGPVKVPEFMGRDKIHSANILPRSKRVCVWKMSEHELFMRQVHRNPNKAVLLVQYAFNNDRFKAHERHAHIGPIFDVLGSFTHAFIHIGFHPEWTGRRFR